MPTLDQGGTKVVLVMFFGMDVQRKIRFALRAIALSIFFYSCDKLFLWEYRNRWIPEPMHLLMVKVLKVCQ